MVLEQLKALFATLNGLPDKGRDGLGHSGFSPVPRSCLQDPLCKAQLLHKCLQGDTGCGLKNLRDAP